MVRYKDENGQIVVIENGVIVDENGNEIETSETGNDNTLSISVIANELKSLQDIVSTLTVENETISKSLEELKKAYTQEFFNSNPKEKDEDPEDPEDEKETTSLSEVAKMF